MPDEKVARLLPNLTTEVSIRKLEEKVERPLRNHTTEVSIRKLVEKVVKLELTTPMSDQEDWAEWEGRLVADRCEIGSGF